MKMILDSFQLRKALCVGLASGALLAFSSTAGFAASTTSARVIAQTGTGNAQGTISNPDTGNATNKSGGPAAGNGTRTGSDSVKLNGLSEKSAVPNGSAGNMSASKSTHKNSAHHKKSNNKAAATAPNAQNNAASNSGGNP
jgi:hypothetical protein